MSLYQNYCQETRDPSGTLTDFTLCYNDDFNFGYDVVDKIAQTEPEKTALVWCNGKGEERVFSFQEIKKLSNKAANTFLSAGINPGDRVMVVLKRHYEYWIVTVALHKIGAVLIPVTHMLTAKDFRLRIRMCRPDAMVVSPESAVTEKVQEAMEEGDEIRRIWTVQEDRE